MLLKKTWSRKKHTNKQANTTKVPTKKEQQQKQNGKDYLFIPFPLCLLDNITTVEDEVI